MYVFIAQSDLWLTDDKKPRKRIWEAGGVGQAEVSSPWPTAGGAGADLRGRWPAGC